MLLRVVPRFCLILRAADEELADCFARDREGAVRGAHFYRGRAVRAAVDLGVRVRDDDLDGHGALDVPDAQDGPDDQGVHGGVLDDHPGDHLGDRDDARGVPDHVLHA